MDQEPSTPAPSTPAADTLAYASPLDAPPATLSVPDLATVLLKLFGVYQLVQALPLLAYIPFGIFAGAYGGSSQALLYVIPLGVPLLVGVLLLTCARWIAVALFGRMGDRHMRMGMPGRKFQAVAFSVAGVVIFIYGVTEFLQAVVTKLASADGLDIDAEPVGWSDVAQSLASAAVQIVGGLWLFFGSKKLAAFWHRLRTEPNPLRPAAAERTAADE